MPRNPAKSVSPNRKLLKSRDLRVLWMLRQLVHAGSPSRLCSSRFDNSLSPEVRRHLGIPLSLSEEKGAAARESASEVFDTLADTLAQLEQRSDTFRLPAILRANLARLGEAFAFNETERLLLALAVLLRVDDGMHEIMDIGKSINAPASIAKVLGVDALEIGKALESGSRLRRSCLIEASSGGSVRDSIQIRRGGLRKLALYRYRSVGEMVQGVLQAAPAPELRADDYAHLVPGFAAVQRLLADALEHGRTGVNVLLHGAPGTGKTQLVRVLAGQLKVPLYEVADLDEDGDAISPRDRLSSAATGLFLMDGRKALVAFDEVDAIFNDGSDFFGKPSTAEQQKSSFNHMLEQNKTPMFWIANRIGGIDPAFVRRFDLVLKLDVPPQKQRLQMLERECGNAVPRPHLQRLSQVDCITPGVVARAASVVRRMSPRSEAESEKLLDSVLDGVLRAQRHPPLATVLSRIDAPQFVPGLCNASVDLDAVAAGLAESGMGRLCLYGPPGTGKTAFGRWLSERLEKPLLLKRVSDLQSPYLGVMERNLAGAFEQARRDGAILQIDEVDSFLQDRRQAQRSWEVSQVNEFLTQLENFDGLFIASTNLADNLDQAALRRFDLKVKFDFLKPVQACELLRRHCAQLGLAVPKDVEALAAARLRHLTPGDCAAVMRQQRFHPAGNFDAFFAALQAETAMKAVAKPGIGFVH